MVILSFGMVRQWSPWESPAVTYGYLVLKPLYTATREPSAPGARKEKKAEAPVGISADTWVGGRFCCEHTLKMEVAHHKYDFICCSPGCSFVNYIDTVVNHHDMSVIHMCGIGHRLVSVMDPFSWFYNTCQYSYDAPCKIHVARICALTTSFPTN